MEHKPAALAPNEVVFPTIHLDLAKFGKESDVDWLIGGIMIFHTKTKQLETGIRAKSSNHDGAVFEARGLFETRDFDPKSEGDVTTARDLSFSFLFPYLRSAISQTFALSGKTIAPFPIIYVRELFGGVQLKIVE